MEFHFVKLNVNGTYLSLVDPSSKPRYMCFAEKPVADRCVQYVADFRSRHGIWPSFDMSNSNRKIETKLDAKPRTPEQVSRYLELETYDFHTIDEIASRTNVSFIVYYGSIPKRRGRGSPYPCPDKRWTETPHPTNM